MCDVLSIFLKIFFNLQVLFLANPLKNIKKYVLFSEIIPLWQDTGHTRWNCHHSMPKSARSSPSMGDLWQIELVGPTLVSTSAKSASHSIFLHWNDLNFCGPVHLIFFRYDSFYNLSAVQNILNLNPSSGFDLTFNE